MAFLVWEKSLGVLERGGLLLKQGLDLGGSLTVRGDVLWGWSFPLEWGLATFRESLFSANHTSLFKLPIEKWLNLYNIDSDLLINQGNIPIFLLRTFFD